MVSHLLPFPPVLFIFLTGVKVLSFPDPELENVKPTFLSTSLLRPLHLPVFSSFKVKYKEEMTFSPLSGFPDGRLHLMRIFFYHGF